MKTGHVKRTQPDTRSQNPPLSKKILQRLTEHRILPWSGRFEPGTRKYTRVIHLTFVNQPIKSERSSFSLPITWKEKLHDPSIDLWARSTQVSSLDGSSIWPAPFRGRPFQVIETNLTKILPWDGFNLESALFNFAIQSGCDFFNRNHDLQR